MCGAFLADSAPKEASAVAFAIAFTVIPYCVGRVTEKWFRADHEMVSELKHISELLGTHTRLLAALANATPDATAAPVPPVEGPAAIKLPEEALDQEEMDRRFKAWQNKRP